MKNKKCIGANNINEVTTELLHENSELLFLPTGCGDLQDSNHEPYLDCLSPESAICLSTGSISLVAVGLGGCRVTLLEGTPACMRFARAVRRGIPSEVKRVCLHVVDNLEGRPSQNCTVQFLKWLYGRRPTSLRTVMRYFLEAPEPWLIGMPCRTASTRFFSQSPVHVDEDGIKLWYRLQNLELELSQSLR